MIPASRQQKIEEGQRAARAERSASARASFAEQVPLEYRKHGLGDLSALWGDALDGPGALALRRHAETAKNERPTFLVLVGPKGTGKSSAAFAVADALIETEGMQARFQSSVTMMSSFSFEREKDFLGMVSTVPLLVIDDLGSVNEGMTAHQERCLWSVIDARWGNHLDTIITSNMALAGGRDGAGLADILGETAWDRVMDSSSVVVFHGESLRGR